MLSRSSLRPFYRLASSSKRTCPKNVNSSLLSRAFRLKSTNAVEETPDATRVGEEGSTKWTTDLKSISNLTAKALIHEINMSQMDNASKVVPWYLENMPASYFRQVNEDLRTQHLTVMSSLHNLSQSDLTVKISKVNEDKTYDVSYLTLDSGNKFSTIGKLYQQITDLEEPENTILQRVKIFSSKDETIDLNVFTFEDKDRALKASDRDPMEGTEAIMEYIKDLKNGKYEDDKMAPAYDKVLYSQQSMKDYFELCQQGYAKNSSPRRFLIQREMFERVKGTDSTVVHYEVCEADGRKWISIASANIYPRRLLRLCANILRIKGLNCTRAHMDTVRDPQGFEDSYGTVSMLRLCIDDREDLIATDQDVEEICYLMERAKWLDDQVVTFGLEKHPEVGIQKAEILNAFAAMLHGDLAASNPHTFASVKSINTLLSSSPHFIQLGDNIAQLFLDRFRPQSLGGHIDDKEFVERGNQIRDKVNELHFAAAKELLSKMLDVCQYTLKTNLYHKDRHALAFRVDPCLLVDAKSDQPMPYGFMFAVGRNFQFFHNRFRDIARGGLRVVTPPNSDQHAIESSRIFSECYGLSWAQQLKNKDIPEGGSKAVCLVNTPSIPEKSRFLETRRAVRACVDSILDLTVSNEKDDMVDYFGKQELIYLGPDEQVVPSDCDWICMRAGERGYAVPMAFMSSKPLAGINHKEFGVTSEGVVVYLDTALKRVLNIDPRTQPFTIKITGGPDGDVGGNLLKILFREYPDTCKVLGIADGSGVAEDPKGLDFPELIRLFDLALPIDQFDQSKLSKEGICMSANDQEGLARRNSMAFRIQSDAFVPAGGRPNTINIDNWEQFLLEDGVTPSSPLIVEGANLFLTPDARKALHERAGVSIVKDSSANKCGVITSSCEVSASMMLTTEEFMANKKEIVADVITRLHEAARDEAELLFREFKHFPGALPHFSERISNAINFVTDKVVERLANAPNEEAMLAELRPLLKGHLPKKIVEMKWDVVDEKLPKTYQRYAIAAILASRLVYREGIHLVESQPGDKIADRAISYYQKTQEMDDLLQNVFKDGKVDINENNQEKIASLLKKGGARTSCDFF